MSTLVCVLKLWSLSLRGFDTTTFMFTRDFEGFSLTVAMAVSDVPLLYQHTERRVKVVKHCDMCRGNSRIHTENVFKCAYYMLRLTFKIKFDKSLKQ